MKITIPRLGRRSPITVEIPDTTPEAERMRVAVVAAVQQGIALDFADFTRADLRHLICPTGARFDGARFDGASFDGARFDGASFDGASFYGASFYGARFDGASFDGARFDGASFYGASFYGASFYGARFDGASFDGARFDGASFDGARFDGASFYGALLAGKRPILTLGPIGSRSDVLIVFRTVDGLRVKAGCFAGTAEAFLDRVKATHRDNDHGRAYRAAMDLAAIMLPPATAEECEAAKVAEKNAAERVAKVLADVKAKVEKAQQPVVTVEVQP